MAKKRQKKSTFKSQGRAGKIGVRATGFTGWKKPKSVNQLRAFDQLRVVDENLKRGQ